MPPEETTGGDSADRLQWRGLWYALAVFAATRALVLTIAILAPQDPSRAGAPQRWSGVPLLRWDGGHYLRILAEGYPPEINDTVAFFPAYPLLARPLAHVMHPYAALIITSHVSALVAVLFFYLWAARRVGVRIACWGVTFLSVYPPAMFLSVAYSDATLLACVAVALWLLDRDRIWAAAAVAAVATATRPTGLVLAAVVVLWAWLRPYRGAGARITTTAGVGIVSALGLVGFQLHLWHHYGRPDAFTAAQAEWKTRPVDDPWLRALTLKPVLQPAFRPVKYAVRGTFKAIAGDQTELARLLEPQIWNPLFNLAMVVLGILGLMRPGHLPRLLYLIPVLTFLEAWIADPVQGGRLVGIARYHLIALPVFVLLATWLQHSRFRYPLVAGAMVLQIIYLNGFIRWEMVG